MSRKPDNNLKNCHVWLFLKTFLGDSQGETFSTPVEGQRYPNLGSVVFTYEGGTVRKQDQIQFPAGGKP